MTPPRVLALIHAYNEADVIGAAIRARSPSRAATPSLLDHGSTRRDPRRSPASGSAAELIGVERFPEESGFPATSKHRMVLRDLLRRCEQLVLEHDGYDWYLINDADDFREAPWPGLTLAEGFGRAPRRLGYNAVNFRVLNFRPTDERVPHPATTRARC